MKPLNQNFRWEHALAEIPEEQLLKQVNVMTRQELLEWLAWNDRNGIFLDEDALMEGLTLLSESEARMCVFAVIMRDRPEWNGYMGDINMRVLNIAVATC